MKKSPQDFSSPLFLNKGRYALFKIDIFAEDIFKIVQGACSLSTIF